MASTSASSSYLVQIASYNTNLQGLQGLQQDLVDWLSPTLQTSAFLNPNKKTPDLIAVGFQETLPLYLGLAGLTSSVIKDREQHILTQIEEHAPGGERYSLVASIVNVGVALLVYAKDVNSGRVHDVQKTWTGCGPGYMGNKGAVGVRLRIAGTDGGVGETFTFVCAHLTAHSHKLKRRIEDYHHIVGTLLFPSLSASHSRPQTIYDTSHLFFFGDLNFRIDLPESHQYTTQKQLLYQALTDDVEREKLMQYDQLLSERRKGTVFVGLREGEFWKFQCSYKYKLGQVKEFDDKRVPSWTDRILYATYRDTPDAPELSHIVNLQYTSVMGYTTSDHKPIVALYSVPESSLLSQEPPTLQLPSHYKPTPDPFAFWKRYSGLVLGRLIGYSWWLLTICGAGSAVVGIFNFVLGLGIWRFYGHIFGTQ